MKYIPGFTFTPQPLKMAGGSVLGQIQKNKKILNDKTFKAGIEYTLHHIIREENQVRYVFIANKKLEEMIFKSIEEAENKISKIVGA